MHSEEKSKKCGENILRCCFLAWAASQDVTSKMIDHLRTPFSPELTIRSLFPTPSGPVQTVGRGTWGRGHIPKSQNSKLNIVKFVNECSLILAWSWTFNRPDGRDKKKCCPGKRRDIFWQQYHITLFLATISYHFIFSNNIISIHFWQQYDITLCCKPVPPPCCPV